MGEFLLPPRRRDRCRNERLVSISKNMSRVLRRGANPRMEEVPNLDLADGGSILVSDLIAHIALRKLHAQRGDIASCAPDAERDQKLRFDIYHGHDGERVWAYQGHTLAVAPPQAHSEKLTNRCLLHGSIISSAGSVFRDCFPAEAHRMIAIPPFGIRPRFATIAIHPRFFWRRRSMALDRRAH